jgi:hypothetical protein
MNRIPLRQGLLLVWSALAPLWLASCVSDSGPSGPVFGSIAIITVTGGPEPDSDGYSVSVDGGGGQPIGTNATLTLDDFSPRAYSVQLGGVASNCVALDGATQTVLVEAGATAEVTFELNCSSEPLPEPPAARLTITDEDQQSVTEGGQLEVTVPPGTFASFTFDASRSEPGAGSAITAYEWQSNGAPISTLQTFEFALDEGEFLITLKVTNSAGLSETASATIIVKE